MGKNKVYLLNNCVTFNRDILILYNPRDKSHCPSCVKVELLRHFIPQAVVWSDTLDWGPSNHWRVDTSKLCSQILFISDPTRWVVVKFFKTIWKSSNFKSRILKKVSWPNEHIQPHEPLRSYLRSHPQPTSQL